ncbi:sensor histidine kinase [Conexibacter sp. S30A1]|jgi:signal transduction histidine kinase|uniref:sensor histidine kinase n=1 Tax=Conexibacter sp. S30A1 TaxID=2937800 RepID=UPI00201033F0|nr:histidine kinase [Conexibacter sp. S30A1]
MSSASSTPTEARVLRSIGAGWLVVLVVFTATTAPQPGLSAHGLPVLAGATLMAVCAVLGRPRGGGPPGARTLSPAQGRQMTLLLGVVAGAVLLAIYQPNGVWLAGPYYVAIVAASTLDRRWGAVMLTAGTAPFTLGALVQGRFDTALSASVAIIPWYLILRLMRMLGERNRELEASRTAAVEAAAQAERARIARELHDVLAHSLSALALQLESTRLLARDRGANPQLIGAIEQAHALAAGGLDDARRAVAVARGEELPGPERLAALAGAFGEQAGLPVAVAVHGEPRELSAEARLAVYRTAQEALTNVRRHAAAERVQISVDYLPALTVLVVENHGAAGVPPPAAPLQSAGHGLAGMRERARLLGGELLASPTDRGFRVELRLPA